MFAMIKSNPHQHTYLRNIKGILSLRDPQVGQFPAFSGHLIFCSSFCHKKGCKPWNKSQEEFLSAPFQEFRITDSKFPLLKTEMWKYLRC